LPGTSIYLCNNKKTKEKKMRILSIVFAVTMAFSGSLPGASLKLISPNGGEELIQGQSFQVKWQAAGIPGKVTLLLIRENAGVMGKIVGGRDAASGNYAWKIGDYQGGTAAAGNYKIRVKSEDGTQKDASDSFFKINEAGTVPTQGLELVNTKFKPTTGNRVAAMSIAAKPDIVITGVNIVPSEPKAGEKIKIVISSQNIGGSVAARSNFKVELLSTYPGGYAFYKILEPGIGIQDKGDRAVTETEEVELVQGGAPVGGDLEVTVTADTINSVEEIREDNNQFKATFPVRSRTDLFVNSMFGKVSYAPGSYKQIHVKTGDQVAITTTIYAYTRFYWANGGSVLSPGKVVVKCPGYQDWTVPANAIKRTPGMGNHTEFTFSIVRAWDTPGQRKIYVDVDVDNQIEESKEFNNTGLFIVNVY
jgi:hypothetical protein